MSTASSEAKSHLSISPDLDLTDADLPYEEEILRNPLCLKLWWRYLIARSTTPFATRSVLYERALRALPSSYKLWHAYLLERLESVRSLPLTHPNYPSLNNTFERALVIMHKMPRIWTMYLESLTHQRLLTRTRHTFDRALRALPVTQHDRIWGPYLAFVSQQGVPVETSLRVHRRYLKFDPNHIEDFIEFLVNSKLLQEAAEHLASVVNDDGFYSIKNKTKHQLWLELCDLLARHANEVSGMNVDAIIRCGIRKFSDEVGCLWTSLADYYVMRGLYEKARDIFEEGLITVVTVRDFSVIFDCYLTFEESATEAKMETMVYSDDEEDGQEEDGSIDARLDLSLSVEKLRKRILAGFWLNDDNDLDLRFARLNRLLYREPRLMNSVSLRQNPHNVEQWHERVRLLRGHPKLQLYTYFQAVKAVDPMKAVGEPHTLSVAFARFCEDRNCMHLARLVFKRAALVDYKTVDHLVSVWREWGSMELRQKNLS